MNLHSINPPSPDVTRQPRPSEVVWLTDYMEPVRNRTELARLKRVRIEPEPTLREWLWLLAGALLATTLGLTLYLVQAS